MPLSLPAPLICGLSHNDFLNFDAELYAILNDMLDLDLGGNYYILELLWENISDVQASVQYIMITGLAHCIE